MRADMPKVIVERARRGMQRCPRQASWEKNAHLDDLPVKEGVRKRHTAIGSRRELNENLSPLRRYLIGQAGRPWNAVYREICLQIRPRSAVQLHVRQHVWDFVERHVTISLDGSVLPAPDRVFGRGQPLRPGDLYIHPQTGLLLRVRRRPSQCATRRR